MYGGLEETNERPSHWNLANVFFLALFRGGGGGGGGPDRGATSVTRFDVIASFDGIWTPVDALFFAFDAGRQMIIFDAFSKFEISIFFFGLKRQKTQKMGTIFLSRVGPP